MTPEDVARLRALAEQATPGPWTVDEETEVGDGLRLLTIPEIERNLHDDEWAEEKDWERDRANAAFIAAAREAIPALCTALEAAWGERDACRNLVARLNGDGGHRQQRVGMKQAAEEAEACVVEDMRKMGALEADRDALRARVNVLNDEIEKPGGWREMVRVATADADALRARVNSLSESLEGVMTHEDENKALRAEVEQLREDANEETKAMDGALKRVGELEAEVERREWKLRSLGAILLPEGEETLEDAAIRIMGERDAIQAAFAAYKEQTYQIEGSLADVINTWREKLSRLTRIEEAARLVVAGETIATSDAGWHDVIRRRDALKSALTEPQVREETADEGDACSAPVPVPGPDGRLTTVPCLAVGPHKKHGERLTVPTRPQGGE